MSRVIIFKTDTLYRDGRMYTEEALRAHDNEEIEYQAPSGNKKATMHYDEEGKFLYMDIPQEDLSSDLVKTSENGPVYPTYEIAITYMDNLYKYEHVSENGAVQFLYEKLKEIIGDDGALTDRYNARCAFYSAIKDTETHSAGIVLEDHPVNVIITIIKEKEHET